MTPHRSSDSPVPDVAATGLSGGKPNFVEDYVIPSDVAATMAVNGEKKGALPFKDIMIRGVISGMLLGFATAVSMSAIADGSPLFVGALLFPVGFVIVILLGFELVTSNFSLLPTAILNGRTTYARLARSWSLVYLANLIGSLFFAFLYYWSTTKFGHADAGKIGATIVERAEMKTLAYEHVGAAAGLGAAFIKAVLCNWMVSLGTVMALVSTSVIGKIAGIWLPIFAFFALGFEHSVVNMFLIPAGILFGDTITIADWWQWNQVIVTLGNIVGAVVLVAMVMYYTHAVRDER
jgi:formate/nitrite transporter